MVSVRERFKFKRTIIIVGLHDNKYNIITHIRMKEQYPHAVPPNIEWQYTTWNRHIQ